MKQYIISVPHVKYGYSIGVETLKYSEDEVLDRVNELGLFEDVEDINYAQVEEMDEEFDKPFWRDLIKNID